MMISTEGTSRYLGQREVPAPFVATMDVVTTVPELRNPDVLHFADKRIKPLPLNLVNRRAIVAIYGKDSAAWHGQPIEIYVDPTVTNSQGRITGGIRLRIPARTSAPAAPKRPAAPEKSPHELLLDEYAAARTDARVDQLATWAEEQRFTPEQRDAQATARSAALERIAMAASPAAPRRQLARRSA
jgi:hypothetical protein